jgi:hypothetical protein
LIWAKQLLTYRTRRIVDLNTGSGAAYTATMYNTKFVIDDRINSALVSENDDFGRGVCMIDDTVFVGAPDDEGNISSDGSTRSPMMAP